jgi:hypothetical protein
MHYRYQKMPFQNLLWGFGTMHPHLCLDCVSKCSILVIINQFWPLFATTNYIYTPPYVLNGFVVTINYYHAWNMSFESICCQYHWCHTCPKWDVILFGLLPNSRWQPNSHHQQKKWKTQLDKVFRISCNSVYILLQHRPIPFPLQPNEIWVWFCAQTASAPTTTN